MRRRVRGHFPHFDHQSPASFNLELAVSRPSARRDCDRLGGAFEKLDGTSRRLAVVKLEVLLPRGQFHPGDGSRSLRRTFPVRRAKARDAYIHCNVCHLGPCSPRNFMKNRLCEPFPLFSVRGFSTLRHPRGKIN